MYFDHIHSSDLPRFLWDLSFPPYLPLFPALSLSLEDRISQQQSWSSDSYSLVLWVLGEKVACTNWRGHCCLLLITQDCVRCQVQCPHVTFSLPMTQGFVSSAYSLSINKVTQKKPQDISSLENGVRRAYPQKYNTFVKLSNTWNYNKNGGLGQHIFTEADQKMHNSKDIFHIIFYIGRLFCVLFIFVVLYQH